MLFFHVFSTYNLSLVSLQNKILWPAALAFAPGQKAQDWTRMHCVDHTESRCYKIQKQGKPWNRNRQNILKILSFSSPKDLFIFFAHQTNINLMYWNRAFDTSVSGGCKTILPVPAEEDVFATAKCICWMANSCSSVSAVVHERTWGRLQVFRFFLIYINIELAGSKGGNSRCP